MSVCTFFGHRDCPETVKASLRNAIIELITVRSVDAFYVGNQGQFDFFVKCVLRELVQQYPHIHYTVVLAYLPGSHNSGDYSDTMFPEGLETVHPRYAISRRNDWMLDRADYVIAYVTHSWGGAAKYVAKATRQRKTVIFCG